LTDPHPEQYFTASSKLWLITVIRQPVRRPNTYSPYCRVKLLALSSVSAGAIYEDVSQGAEGPLRRLLMVAVYWSQFIARTQFNCMSLQEFMAAIDQLPHQALVGLPED
jgi:hypothetical protein